jgi:hypothetical protein
VGVVSFAGTAAVVQAPTVSREDVVAAIDRFQMQRATAIGSGLIGIGAANFAVFMIASLFIGTGVGIVVGGTLRTVVLDVVSASQRSAAQALVNIMIAIGNLLVVAVLSALADQTGGGLHGLSVAYLAATGVMLGMLVLSLRLPAADR